VEIIKQQLSGVFQRHRQQKFYDRHKYFASYHVRKNTKKPQVLTLTALNPNHPTAYHNCYQPIELWADKTAVI
jgi:hypothetical protein